MDRKDFLTALSKTTAFACLGCLASCVQQTEVPTNTSKQFNIDLNNHLLNIGDFIILGGITIVRIANNNIPSSFSAVNNTCTHAGYQVIYHPESTNFICPGHGSVYSPDGIVVKPYVAGQGSLAQHVITMEDNLTLTINV